METTIAAAEATGKSAPKSGWNNSDTLFLLNCYDVWSATPPRGCLCGDPAPESKADD